MRLESLRRTGRDSGQAMIALALAITVILASGAAILATNVIQHDPIVQKDVVEHYAYRAVESGFDVFLSTVNTNPNQINCNLKSTDRGECPPTRFDIWRPVTGTTGGAGVVPEYFKWLTPKLCYNPACKPPSSPTTSLSYVKETIRGRAGFPGHYVYEDIMADLESENGFLTHIWWSDYEASDPITTTHSTSACTFDWNNTYDGPNVPLPTIATVTPTSGPATGGTPVVITGTHLADATSVRFGTTTAASFQVTHTEVKAVTPAEAAGTVEVSVTATGGTARKPTGFTFTALPTVTGVTPNRGSTGGGTRVTITGTNFTAKTARVTFGGVAATTATVTSPTRMTATSPAHAAGPVTVAVTNLGGTGTDPSAFTYVVAPTVSGVSPVSGSTGGGTTVTITGTSFNATSASVKFGSTTAASFTVTSSTMITAITKPHAAGTVGVTVSDSSGAGGKTTAFTFATTPTITGITPTGGPTKGGTRVVITGTNFSAKTASVTFATAPATTVTITSATRMTAKSPVHATGTVGVTVTNLGGSVTKTSTYTYKALGTTVTVTSVTPQFGPATTTTTVIIHGHNFPIILRPTGLITSLVIKSVTFGTKTVRSFLFFGGSQVRLLNATEIAVRAPSEHPGTVAVTVTTTLIGVLPLTTTTEPTAFTYVGRPTVGKVTPDYGPTTGDTKVAITGTGFIGVTAVTFGGVAATTVAVTSSTRITATTPAHAAGKVAVTVATKSSKGTANTAFTYETSVTSGAVTVTAVTPNRGHGGTRVTITGTGFETPSTVTFGTIRATTVTVTSSTRIHATAPVENGGTVAVSVTDAAGTGTLPTAFTYINTGACSPIFFASTTQVYGPIYSNDSFYVETANVPSHLGPIGTHDPKYVAVTATPTTGRLIQGITSATSVTGTPDKDNMPFEPIPVSDSALFTYAAEHLPTGRGCLYHGPTTIEFDTEDQMTVWSPDSTLTATCLPSQGATVDVPNGIHPTTLGDGVIYVATETTPAKCKAGANPLVGHYDHIGSTTPNCEADVFVSDHPAPTSPAPTPAKPTTDPGVSGQLTVGSSANIVVTGNIEYTHCGASFNSTKTHPCTFHPAGTNTPTHPTRTEPNDVLGLIANNYVEVNHPVGGSASTCSSTVLGTPTAAKCDPGPVTIDAAILALQHSFAVNNYATGPAIGTLTVYGSIDQKWRGAVGTFSGSTAVSGYTKDYDWDSLITAVAPPHYLAPATPSWALASSAVSPASTTT